MDKELTWQTADGRIIPVSEFHTFTDTHLANIINLLRAKTWRLLLQIHEKELYTRVTSGIKSEAEEGYIDQWPSPPNAREVEYHLKQNMEIYKYFIKEAERRRLLI